MAKINLEFNDNNESFSRLQKNLDTALDKLKKLGKSTLEFNKDGEKLNKNLNTTNDKFTEINKNLPKVEKETNKLVKSFGSLGKTALVAFSTFEILNFTNTTVNAFGSVTEATFNFSNALDNTNDALLLMQAEGFNTDFIQKLELFTKGLTGNIAASREFAVTSVSAFDGFEAALTRVNTILSTTKDNLLLNGKQIQSIVNTELKNAVTSVEALASQYEVLSGGFTTTKDSQQVLTAALKLSTAGQADAGEVTRLLVSSMRAYGLSATQAAETASILNGVVEQGITTVSELTQGFGQAAGVAKQAGISIEELGASIAVLTTKGIRTPIALTSFQSLAELIISKTPEAEKALARLRDSSGNVIRFDASEIQAKGFTKSLQDLNAAIDGNAATLAEIIPEAQAYRAALALMADNSRELERVTVSLGEKTAEALDKVFGISLDNRTQEFTAIVNSFGEAMIELGSRLAPVFEQGIVGIEKLVGFIDIFNDLPEPVKQTAISFIGLQLGVSKTVEGTVGLIGTFVKLTATIIGARIANETFGGILSGNTRRITNQIDSVRDLVKSKSGLANIIKELAFGGKAYLSVLNSEEVAIKRLNEYYKIKGQTVSDSLIKEEAAGIVSSRNTKRAKEVIDEIRISTGELKRTFDATGKEIVTADNVLGNFVSKPYQLAIGGIRKEFIELGAATKNTFTGPFGLSKQTDDSVKKLNLFTYTWDRSGKVVGGTLKGLQFGAKGLAGALGGAFSFLGPVGTATLAASAAAFLIWNSRTFQAYQTAGKVKKELQSLNEEIRTQERDLSAVSSRWRQFYDQLGEGPPTPKKNDNPLLDPLLNFFDEKKQANKILDKKFKEIQQQLEKEGFDIQDRKTYKIPEVKERFKAALGENIDISPQGATYGGFNPFGLNQIAREADAVEEYSKQSIRLSKSLEQIQDTYELLQSGGVLSPQGRAKQRANLPLSTDDLSVERKQIDNELQSLDISINSITKRKEQLAELQKDSRSQERINELENEIQSLSQEESKLRDLRDEYAKLADKREQFFTGQAALNNNLFGTKEDLVTTDQLEASAKRVIDQTNKALKQLQNAGFDVTKAIDGDKLVDKEFNDIANVQKSGNTAIMGVIRDVLKVDQSTVTNLPTSALTELRKEINSEDNKRIEQVFDKFKTDLGFAERAKLTKEQINSLKSTYKSYLDTQLKNQDELDNTLADLDVVNQQRRDLLRKSNLLQPEDVAGSRIQNLARSELRLATGAFDEFKAKYEEFSKFAALTDEQRKKQLDPEQLKEFNEVFVNGQVEGQKRLLEAIDSLDRAQAAGSITAKEYSERLNELNKSATLAGKPILKARDQIELLAKTIDAETEAIKRSIENLERKKALVDSISKLKITNVIFDAETDQKLIESRFRIQQTLAEAEIGLLENKNSITKDVLERAKLDIEIKKESLVNLREQQARELEILQINQRLVEIKQQAEDIESRTALRQAKNEVLLKQQDLKNAKTRGAEDDIADATLELQLAQQAVKAQENSIKNEERLKQLRKELNADEIQSLQIRNKAEVDRANTDIRLAELEKISAEYEIQLNLISRQNQLIDIQSNSFSAIINAYSQTKEQQIQLLEATKSSREAELNSIKEAYSLAKNLFTLDYTKRKLTKEEAEFTLATLDKRNKLEREIFELQQEQKEIARQRLEIENQISQAKLKADIKVKETELEKLKATGASDAEIKAKEFDIGATTEQLIGVEFEGELIRNQNRSERRLADFERRALTEKEQLDRFRVRSDLAQSTLGKADDIALRKELLEFARKGSQTFERNLNKSAERPEPVISFDEFATKRRKELNSTLNFDGVLDDVKQRVTELTVPKVEIDPSKLPKIELVLPKTSDEAFARLKESADMIRDYYEQLSTEKNDPSKKLEVTIKTEVDFKNTPANISGTDISNGLKPAINQSILDALKELDRGAL